MEKENKKNTISKKQFSDSGDLKKDLSVEKTCHRKFDTITILSLQRVGSHNLNW